MHGPKYLRPGEKKNTELRAELSRYKHVHSVASPHGVCVCGACRGELLERKNAELRREVERLNQKLFTANQLLDDLEMER